MVYHAWQLSKEVQESLCEIPYVRVAIPEYLLVEIAPARHTARFGSKRYDVAWPWTYFCFNFIDANYTDRTYMVTQGLHLSPYRIKARGDRLYSPWTPNQYGGYIPCFDEKTAVISLTPEAIEEQVQFFVTKYFDGIYNCDDLDENLFQHKTFRYWLKKDPKLADVFFNGEYWDSWSRFVRHHFKTWAEYSMEDILDMPRRYWDYHSTVGTMLGIPPGRRVPFT